jgi:signal transduction histidine kinase
MRRKQCVPCSSGIGLAICAKVVRRYGGTIAAQGIIGEGSKFAITLPKKQQSHFSPDVAADESEPVLQSTAR